MGGKEEKKGGTRIKVIFPKPVTSFLEPVYHPPFYERYAES